MLQFLETLNPWNFCFTVTDFDDALLDIQSLLKNWNAVFKEDKSRFFPSYENKQHLEKAFSLALKCLKATNKQRPDKQLAFFIAETLKEYAIAGYHENYFATKQLLLVAFNLYLYSIGIFNECVDICDYSSLMDLKKQGEMHPSLFSTIEQSILTTSMEHCLTVAYTSSFIQLASLNRLYCLAEISRWLGHCYQHIDETKTIHPENDLRFTQLFKLSESLLILIDQEESKRALAELYYQAWPFLHERHHPEDTSRICQLYELALHYDSSPEMNVRVANQHFLTLFSKGHHEEALPYLKKAIFLAETLKDNDNTRFLLTKLYDNYTNYFMQPETLNLEQAEIYLEKTLEHVAELKAVGKNFVDFALYEIRLAEFKFVTGDLSSALQAIERALIILQKYPQSQYPHVFKAEAMKSLLSKRINSEYTEG